MLKPCGVYLDIQFSLSVIEMTCFCRVQFVIGPFTTVTLKKMFVKSTDALHFYLLSPLIAL